MTIEAIQLTRDTKGMCVVSIKINDEWISVIKDNGDIINHTVEHSGIERAIYENEFVCCGCPTVGGEYMGQQELICCGNPVRK